MILEGKILGNRYEIIEKVGNGGMATVYRAEDKVLKRNVAVKVLKDEFTTDEEFIKRFEIEAQSAARLTHPNIVSIYDVGSEDNALDNTYISPRDRILRVCSPDDYVTVIGGAAIKNDGTICPTFDYQQVGVMVNGITAVKNEPFTRYYTAENVDRDLSKGEVANGGGLAVLNAYTGKLVTGFEYDALGVTTEGFTPVKKGDKWGLVRVYDGEVIIDCILDNISNVYAGKVYVEYEGKKGVLALNTTLGLGIAINAETLS